MTVYSYRRVVSLGATDGVAAWTGLGPPAWDGTMLVLSRKVGQRILIGDRIAVTVVRVAQGAVRIGIEAPDDLPIVREEIKLDRKEPTDATKAARES